MKIFIFERNGAHQGWNGGPMENNHIAMVKNFVWLRERWADQFLSP
jgi:hypothetical protein